MITIGREASRISELMANEIAKGTFGLGGFLPTERTLAAKYGVAPMTARRALKALESQGYLTAQPRKGYRVMARGNDPDRGLPIAFVAGNTEETELWDEFHRILFACLQKAALDRGWSMMALGTGGRTGRELVHWLTNCRVCGMIVDASSPEHIRAAEQLGMPTVMVDSWDPEMRMDAVVQDSFCGALMAVEYLVRKGHRRIAWLGPISDSYQSRERFGGFCAGVAAAGLELLPQYIRDTPWSKMKAVALDMLARTDRPTGILGFWYSAAAAADRAARTLGLFPGKDVEILGWTCEEEYNTTYRLSFSGQPMPPTMVWSMAELARLAVGRLADRRVNPGQMPMLVKTPSKLRQAENTTKEMV